MNAAKKQNPGLKTLLATGGWNAGSRSYSDMVATRTSRDEFVASTVDFLRQRDFDGLDMDWEYPAKRGGRPEDKQKLVLLLEVSKVMSNIDNSISNSSKTCLILSNGWSQLIKTRNTENQDTHIRSTKKPALSFDIKT